ncbi:DUF1329 domain-containing protein [Arhodomonas aquaeolei]|uniref:DUF1329 domain-containing protein n=1 Tax=Arhodomonas TaxID=2368 RepID=UPI0013D5D334|nr:MULTISPECIES: DUF1329 domain-containing protein [Arhodomonas]MCS4505511.1 DUF1329 domain-containing protein [Arhodomonas aquaeolei]
MTIAVKRRLLSSALLAALAGSLATPAVAGEVAEGTVLSADNYDTLKDRTLDGVRIGDMITDRFEMWIRDYGLTMKLGKAREPELDPAYFEATEKYAGKATLNPETKKVEGYVAGIPFPNVSEDDPDAGYKLAWNHYYANPIMGDNWIAIGDTRVMEADSGVVDRFTAVSAKMLMEGRTTREPVSLGNEDEHANYLLVLTEPYDVAGLGIFTKQYNTGKADDAWVYVKSIRRTRRVAGGQSWMDPQPKMDLLNDDNQGINAYPLWYEDWKVVDRRYILTVTDAHNPNEEYPLDKEVAMEPPYWNPINVTWRPQEVFVIEATPPEEHPYGKKVLYMDTDYPLIYHSEIYDKKGDFWRMWRQSYGPITAGNGEPGLGFIHTQAIDFQRERATYIDIVADKLNTPKLTADSFTPRVLQQAASGQLEELAQ